MRIKLLFLFLIGCIIAKYLAAPSEIQAEKQDYKLKVGVIFPLSGPAASVGNAAKNGMQLAYQNLSDDLKNRLEIFYEDDSLSPAKSISSYRRLLQDIGVQVVVNASSITGKALSPIAERDQIPLITISSDPEVVENRKFVVSFWVNAEDEAEAILMEARRRGYKKIARVTSSDPFCLAIHAAFDSKNNDDPEVMLDEEYTAEVKDFRTYLSRISTNKEIDAIMLGLMPGQLGIFAKQARSMGLTIPFFGYEMMEDLNELKVSEGALENQWYVNIDAADTEFFKKYQKLFPEASPFAAPQAHDILLLLAHAAKHRMNSSELNHFLHTVSDFKGASGVFSANGKNSYTLPMAVKMITKDGFKRLRPGEKLKSRS